MVGAQQSNLTVLSRISYRLGNGEFDVEIVLGEIEIRCKEFYRLTSIVPRNRKRPRFILPRDAIEVEEPREFGLTRMRKKIP